MAGAGQHGWLNGWPTIVSWTDLKPLAMYDKIGVLSFSGAIMRAKPENPVEPALSDMASRARIGATMRAVASLGLTDGRKDRRLSLRANDRLIQAAQQTSGLEGSELLEYALAKVALEDDFAEKLLALRGSVSRDIDLEF